LSSHYKINKSEEQGYSFVTDKGITFVILLEKSSFSPPYGDFLFDFSFFPVVPKHNRNKEQHGYDHKVCKTLINFIEELFHQDSRNSILFICDSTDRREEFRKHLFDKWFNEYSNERFEKLDFKLVTTGSNFSIPTYISVVTLIDNPHMEDLKEFSRTNMEEFESFKFE
jgi:hypothetical protein